MRTVRCNKWLHDVSLILIAAATMLHCTEATATQASYRLCFTQVVGLPITNPNQPPTIDGIVPGDPGWTHSFRYEYGNGTAFPSAAVQGIKDDSFLYLSVEVNNDATFDDYDVVIFYFSPSDGVSTAEDRRLVIYPNRSTLKVDYWKDRTTWSSPASSAPASLQVARNQNSTNHSWNLEIKVPLTGADSFNLPTTSNFGLYWDVIRVNNNTGGSTEYTWPSFNSNGLGQGNEETVTKAPASWGNGTLKLGETCNGISMDWSDITSNTPPDQIDVRTGNANNFSAVLHNNSVDRNGNPVGASQITAKFSIANFGLASNWTPVLAPSSQLQGPVDILPNNTATITSSPNWNINSTNSDINNYINHPDQCILVDLDTKANALNDPSCNVNGNVQCPPDCNTHPDSCVTFTNKSVKRNMWILSASEVSKTAEISARGYSLAVKDQTHQEFLLHVLHREEVLNPNQKAMLATSATATPSKTGGRRDPRRIISRLTWAVDGCRLNGEYIFIQKKKFYTCEDVGAFGAIVEHVGATPVQKWKTTLEGEGLQQDEKDKSIYRLKVPADGVSTVKVDFHPEEKGGKPLALFLDFGGNFPHPNFSQVFNKGFSLNAGLEYAAKPNLSLEGIFGYHHFPVKSVAGGVLSDLNVYQFSANLKYYALNGTIGGHPAHLFFNFGPGGYKFSSADTYFGGNIGTGVLVEFSHGVGLQGSYNFHAIKTPGATTEFSTAQAGLRFVF